MRFRLSFAARRASPVLVLGLLALGGCQSMRPSGDKLLGVITPYKIEIVQGNVVTQEQAALIRPGMSRIQVREILGSPLLTDVFHANRWDYVFTIRRQGAEPRVRRVVVRFAGDALESIDTGGDLPTEHEFISSIDTFKTAAKTPDLELSAAQIQALPVPPAASAASPAEPTGPARSYPPLESTR